MSTVHTKESGFTLVEMIVSVGLFAVVMLISVGSLLSLTGANRKAQALQSVMNNLNIALDGMVRNVRMGTTYNCVNGISTSVYTADCPNGSDTFSFEPFGNKPGDPAWEYKFIHASGSDTGYIERSENGGGTWVRLTAPEVSIESMTFYVTGSTPGSADVIQPKVLIVVRGSAGTGAGQVNTTFHIQATAVQRALDLK